MPQYEVVKPFRSPAGRDLKTGESVELTVRQAKYLKLSGKLREPASKKKPLADKEK
jgi:hypothetical protein